jgi:2-dehydropantoate 2-reductase
VTVRRTGLRVCVAGAGTIGSLFAAHLARVADVSVLTRREEHARALNEHGLHVSGRADFTAALTAATDPGLLQDPDLVIVACKGGDLEPLAARLEGHFPAATVMTVQNGLGAEEIVAAHGGWPLLSAVTFMSGTRHDDTHVEYVLDTATWIGPQRGTTPADAERTAELIRSSGLKAESFDDLRPAQWSKLIFNATVNAVAALTGLPHDHHFAEGPLGELVHGLVDEGKAVAAAAGVALREDPWEMNVLATQRGHAHYPSMLEDVSSRRPTEIELITGSLVREAARHDVPVPLHASLYALVKGREASYS